MGRRVLHNLSPMKAKLFQFSYRNLLLLLPLFALVSGGCSMFSDQKKDTGLMDQPSTNYDASSIAYLHVGDTVTISFSGLPDPLEPQEKPIKDDGTITLDYIGQVQAAGKTPSELQNIIHDLYVPKYYTHLDVTVKTSNDRVFYVSGEVRQPNRVVYAGPITVSKAISSVGDFTDFANHKKVYLIRANGNRYILNMDAILSGEAPDPPVYPGDQIVVGRRIL
jgi:polysaccharide export outer membrane protein